MDSFDWNRSKEDLLTEMRIALSDVFDGTDYSIVRNPTQGEKMNNIYRRGRNKRSAFVMRPSQILCKPPIWCRIEAPYWRF